MILLLTNVYKGNLTDKIAVNTDIVVSIFESITDDNVVVSNLYTLNDKTFSVEESMDDIIAKINGKKKWVSLNK